jgi:hypothetical protein
MSAEVHQDHVDWPDWLRRWDAQQEGYVPEREARFTAMFDASRTGCCWPCVDSA